MIHFDFKGDAAIPQGLPDEDIERRRKVHAEFRKQGVSLRFQVGVHPNADIGRCHTNHLLYYYYSALHKKTQYSARKINRYKTKRDRLRLEAVSRYRFVQNLCIVAAVLDLSGDFRDELVDAHRGGLALAVTDREVAGLGFLSAQHQHIGHAVHLLGSADLVADLLVVVVQSHTDTGLHQLLGDGLGSTPGSSRKQAGP